MRKKVGKYWVYEEESLGSGERYKVYLAINSEHPGSKVAAKISSIVNQNFNSKELTRELQMQRAVESPGTAKLLDCVMTKNNVYLFQELCEGGSLQQLIDLNPQGFLIAQALNIIVKVLQSYDCLRQKHISHGSLNPSSILIKHKILKIDGFKYSQKYGQANIIGQRMSENYDVFGFGAIFYNLVYGKLTFPDDLSKPETIEWFSNNNVNFPHIDCVEQLASKIKSLIAKCLRIDEMNRCTWPQIYNNIIFKQAFKALPDLTLSDILYKLKLSVQRQKINMDKFYAKYSKNTYNEDEFITIMECLSPDITTSDSKYLMKMFGKSNKGQIQMFIPDLKPHFLKADIINFTISAEEVVSCIFENKKTIFKNQHKNLSQTNQKAQKKINLQLNDKQKYIQIVNTLKNIIDQKDIDLFELFSKNDKERNNKLDPFELAQLLNGVGVVVNKEDFKGVFQLFDIDGNGFISLEEFFKTVSQMVGMSPRPNKVRRAK